MTWVEGLGWLSAALAIGGAAMKTIIPLRCLGIAMNVISLVCSAATLNLPGIVANVVLLPVNGYRLVQMIKLVGKVRRAASSDLSMDWLKPFMTRRTAKAGEVLFAKGDVAECMFYTLTGPLPSPRVRDCDPAGAVLSARWDFLAPDNRRTQTLECLEDGEVPHHHLRRAAAALFPEPRIRLLLPAAHERTHVPEHGDDGAGAGAPAARFRRESGLGHV